MSLTVGSLPLAPSASSLSSRPSRSHPVRLSAAPAPTAHLARVSPSAALRPSARAGAASALRLQPPPGLWAEAPRRRLARAAAGEEAAPAKKVLVPIADGSEEIEAVTIIDVLRRAGAEVVVCSVEDGRKEVVCSRGVRIVADVEVKEIAGRGAPSWDLIAVPGGMPGSEHIGDHIRLHMVLEKHFKAGKPMGAICAAPSIVFEPKGFLEGFAATAHPAFVEELGGSLEEKSGYAPARVLVDNQIVTSRGPGTSMEFALCLVEKLYGREKAAEVAGPMVVQPLEPAPRIELEWRL